MSALALTHSRSGRRAVAESATGAAALAVAVVAAGWLAAGTAATPRLLQLPARTVPGWVEGPLHGLAGHLSNSGFSVGLLALSGAYLTAIACARVISVPVAMGAVAAATVAFTLGPTFVSSDVFGYIAYAREAALHGLNPYVSPPAALGHDAILGFVYWKHQATPYGPLFTLLSVPLGLISIGAALWVLKALAGAAAVALAAVCANLARRRGLDPSRAAILVGLNPVLLVYAVGGAHNDLLAALLVVCAFSLVDRGREATGAATAIAAGAIKLTVGLALPFVVLLARARRRGTALGGAGLALLAVGVPTVALYGGHIADQLHRISTQRQFDIAFSGPSALASALSTQVVTGVRIACVVAAGAVAVAMIVKAARGGDPIAAAGWAFLALVASIASLAPWYLVWVLPLAAVSRSRSLAAVTVLATAYLVAVHLPVVGGVPWLTPA